MPETPTIAIIGATGAVGREALAILAELHWPIDRVIAMASARSAGSSLPFGAGEIRVEEFNLDQLEHAACAILCTDSALSREYAPLLIDRGIVVIDNSSAFRLDPRVPLVVPEINASTIAPDALLIANPNCSTIIMLLALEPLRIRFGIDEVIVSTYQAVSGAGIAGIDELHDQTRAALEGRQVPPSVFPHSCAFNVFPHESPLDPDTGRNGEEVKMIAEAQRIWDHPGLSVIPTCVRVPVVRAHSQSILVTLRTPATISDVRTAIGAGPGLRVVDDWANAIFPTPHDAAGGNDVLVGRVRKVDAPEQPHTPTHRFQVWACGDQLRKGAALNALQIAQHQLTARPPARRHQRRSTTPQHAHSPTPIGS